ncbi:MAG: FecCD family ABC transporter permease [Endomicrobiia bacterium]
MKKKIFYFLLILIFISNTIFSLFYNLNAKQLINSIKNKNYSSSEYKIFTQIRIPRTVATYFIGAGLSIVGCVLQSIFLNPLCEGYTLGISSSAGLGVILGTILNLPFTKFFNSLLGITISLVVIYLLILISKKTIDISFVLTGIVVNFLFSSITILLTLFFDPYKINYVLLWLLGSFSYLDSNYFYFLCFMIIFGIVIILVYSSNMDIVVLGKEKSNSLGVDEQKTKNVLIIISVAITAICVSLTGVISFVGIIIPNAVKIFTGIKHKSWFIWSAVSGGIFISLCDNLARNLFYPVEIPISVLTGIVGSLFFILYLIKGNFYGNTKN